MSLSDAIAAFQTKGPNGDGSYTVTRQAAATYTLGRGVPGSVSTFPIFASVQPTNGRDLKALAEAQITSESRVVLTTTELRARTAASEPDAIALEADSVPWVVFESRSIPDLDGGTYYRIVAARKSMT